MGWASRLKHKNSKWAPESGTDMRKADKLREVNLLDQPGETHRVGVRVRRWRDKDGNLQDYIIRQLFRKRIDNGDTKTTA